ncbi:MAG: hypothetical protein ACREM6_02910 [Vulcanimicrobiaceae bacterium]
MHRRPFLHWLVAGFVAPVGYLASRIRAGVAAPTQSMMGHGMMCDDMMSRGNMQGPMRTGMELFARHVKVKRTVTDIPGGVHAVSESDDPRTAALLQEHVATMYARLDADHPFPYPMSRSVPAMFENSTRYHRRLTMLANGVAVSETSDDPEMVDIIRAHAREITGFVQEGMPAMMQGMMR